MTIQVMIVTKTEVTVMMKIMKQTVQLRLRMGSGLTIMLLHLMHQVTRPMTATMKMLLTLVKATVQLTLVQSLKLTRKLPYS
jgi:hypothetical protein